MVDARIGDYKIVRKIAEGNVGEVLEGIDPLRNRRAAIKCLRHEVANPSELLKRFDSEAQTLALLVHPHIARVLSFIRQDDRLYLALEFVEGETLEAILKRRGRIEPPVSLSFFQQILRAVGFAHRIGVIHGDIKPANIIVTKSGPLKVMDFGIAHIFGRPRKTSAGYLAGTIQYMSPEQIRGEPLDARSDIYSLGILLYELIVGHVPFDSDSDDEIMRAQSKAIPLPPSLFVADSPAWLDAVLRRALAKARSNRFQSIPEMAQALGFELEASDVVWRAQPAARIRREARRISSVWNPIWMSRNRVLGPLRATLATGAEVALKQGGSAARVLRSGIEASNPRAWAKRAAIGIQRVGGRMSSSSVNLLLLLGSRAMVSSRSLITGATAVGGKVHASLAYATGRAAETVHRHLWLWTKQVGVRLQRADLRKVSASNSVVAITNRVFGYLRTTSAASDTNWKQTAVLASLLIAIGFAVIFFDSPTSETSLNESVDKFLAQANRDATTVSPPPTPPERQVKVAQPVDQKPAVADKQQRSPQSSNNKPEPAPTKNTELSKLPSTGSGSAKQAEPVAPKQPSPPEPVVSEKKADANVARTKLNVKWEN